MTYKTVRWMWFRWVSEHWSTPFAFCVCICVFFWSDTAFLSTLTASATDRLLVNAARLQNHKNTTWRIKRIIENIFLCNIDILQKKKLILRRKAARFSLSRPSFSVREKKKTSGCISSTYFVSGSVFRWIFLFTGTPFQWTLPLRCKREFFFFVKPA